MSVSVKCLRNFVLFTTYENAQVQPHFDYCSFVWAFAAKVSLKSFKAERNHNLLNYDCNGVELLCVLG